MRSLLTKTSADEGPHPSQVRPSPPPTVRECPSDPYIVDTQPMETSSFLSQKIKLSVPGTVQMENAWEHTMVM